MRTTLILGIDNKLVDLPHTSIHQILQNLRENIKSLIDMAFQI